MSLDEAIKYIEEVAEENEKEAKKCHEDQIRKIELFPFSEMDYTFENWYKKDAEIHRQILEYLKELKQLRKQLSADCINRRIVKEQMIKYGFHAPDMTVTEFVEDCLFEEPEFPTEHGRLSDMDELVKKIVKEYGVNSTYELPQDIKMFYDKFISSAPTILDATFDYKLKNYAFLLPPCEMRKTESEE